MALRLTSDRNLDACSSKLLERSLDTASTASLDSQCQQL